MKNKVYCKDCKHVKKESGCKIISQKISTAIETHVLFGDCMKINKNNDCPDFEPKLWYRIKQLFRSKK